MAKEIEHKYLIKDNSYKDYVESSHYIRQGYLTKDKERTVRIRTYDNKGYITIKSKNIGDVRNEYEYEIDYKDALEMLETICLPDIIEKERNIIIYGGNKWEIDVFKGKLEGLIFAEIEIPYSNYQYKVPEFIGENVTGNPKYYNSNIFNFRI